MEEQKILIELSKQGEQIKELGRRMDNLEKLTEIVNKLAVSVQKLATSMETTEKNVDKLQTDVALIHDRPAKRWDTLIAAVIAALVGAAIAYFTK